ncbi:gamma-glutamyltransferase [Streptomyces sp. GLT-R25]
MATIAIAAPHPAAIEAARQVTAAGGGLIDAALAAAAALTVAYPHQCSIGGDLVALIRDGAHGTVRAVLSAGAAAAATDPASLRAAGERMPAGGPHTVTVPGVVAGWAELARLGARLPLARSLAPAIALADGGVPVSEGLARAIHNRLDVVRADPGLSALLLDKAGEPLAVGATLVQPALAATLEELSEDWRHFYTGPTARRLVAGLRERGSLLDAADFAGHRAENTDPLSTTTGNGVTWWAAPPPSQGASLLGPYSDATAIASPPRGRRSWAGTRSSATPGRASWTSTACCCARSGTSPHCPPAPDPPGTRWPSPPWTTRATRWL